METNRLPLAITVLLAALATAGIAGAQKADPQLLWWNDPVIVEELSLERGQRQKMDQAYEAYRKTVEPLRRTPTTRMPYLDALERGDWATAETELEKWLQADRTPKQAMGELKLAILPMLSGDQRARLLEKYPRLVRRSWSPNPRWGAGRPQRKPGQKKPARGPKGDE